MKNLFAFFLLIFLLTSCSDENTPKGVLIRVENASGVDFKDVFISSGSSSFEFGYISAGQRSDYQEFESAYRYGFVSLLADGKELRIQPIDYVGETPLSKGYYTYKIGVDSSDPNDPFLTFDFVIVN